MYETYSCIIRCIKQKNRYLKLADIIPFHIYAGFEDKLICCCKRLQSRAKRGRLNDEIVLWMYCSDPIGVILLGTYKVYGATAVFMEKTSLNKWKFSCLNSWRQFSSEIIIQWYNSREGPLLNSYAFAWELGRNNFGVISWDEVKQFTVIFSSVFNLIVSWIRVVLGLFSLLLYIIKYPNWVYT